MIFTSLQIRPTNLGSYPLYRKTTRIYFTVISEYSTTKQNFPSSHSTNPVSAGIPSFAPWGLRRTSRLQRASLNPIRKYRFSLRKSFWSVSTIFSIFSPNTQYYFQFTIDEIFRCCDLWLYGCYTDLQYIIIFKIPNFNSLGISSSLVKRNKWISELVD